MQPVRPHHHGSLHLVEHTLPPHDGAGADDGGREHQRAHELGGRRLRRLASLDEEALGDGPRGAEEAQQEQCEPRDSHVLRRVHESAQQCED